MLYHTEIVFTSSGGTGCIYSTLFDAHIIVCSAVSITSIVFPYKIRTISYMHIFSIVGRLYHINRKLYMHINSIFSRMYHINSQFFVYAFAPSRVLLFYSFHHSNVKCSDNLKLCHLFTITKILSL